MKTEFLRVRLVAFAILAVLPANSWCQVRPRPGRPVSQIRGEVRYVASGAAPHGVLVTLSGIQAGSVRQIQTDSRGRFEFQHLDADFYEIRARQHGYIDASERVDLTTAASGYVVLELRTSPEKKPVSPVPPEGPRATITVDVPAGAQEEFLKGQQLLNAEGPEKSISHFRKAIKLHERFPAAYLMLGLAYLGENKLAEAQSALERAIELDPQSAGAYLSLGALFNQQRNFQSAENVLRRGLELNPEAGEGHYELAKTYWLLGRWQEAEPNAVKAISLRPDLAAAQLLMGNILLRKRDAEGALTKFKLYLNLEPNGPMAESARQMVSKIEKALADSKAPNR